MSDPPGIFNQAEDYARMLGRGNLPLHQFFKEAAKPARFSSENLRSRGVNAESRYALSNRNNGRSTLLSLVPTIGEPSEYGSTRPMGFISTAQGYLDPVLEKQADNARQRHFLEQHSLFHPATWYVPMINNSSIIGPQSIAKLREAYEQFPPTGSASAITTGIVRPEKPTAGGRGGIKDLDAALFTHFEWHSDQFEPAVELIKHMAEERTEASGQVLLGKSEQEAWQHNEIASITPIRNDKSLIQLLGEMHEPLPEQNRGRGISSHDISVLRRMAPRRPMRLYPLLLSQHPVKTQVDLAKITMDKRKSLPQIWTVSCDSKGKYGYVCQPLGELESMATPADKNRVDKQCGTDDHKTSDNQSQSRNVVDVVVHHDKPDDISSDPLERTRVQAARQNLVVKRMKHFWQQEREEIHSVLVPKKEHDSEFYRPEYRLGERGDKNLYYLDVPLPEDQAGDSGNMNPRHRVSRPLINETEKHRKAAAEVDETLDQAKREVSDRLEDYRTLMFNRLIAPLLERSRKNKLSH